MSELERIFTPEFLGEIRRGAEALRTDSYPLCQNTIGDEELRAVVELFPSFRFTMGEQVRALEDAFARRVGAEAAVMVNSGSSANLIAVASLLYDAKERLAPGDEVLVPALSWPTTVWPVAQLGLKPVFVDCNRTDLSVCLESCAAAAGPRTRALMLVHVLGAPANMDDVRRFCADRGLALLEDCCESLGAAWDGVHVGNFGALGTFSFYYSHHMTTVEGGMVVTSDADRADVLRAMRAHGWSRERSDRARWRDAYPDIDDRFLFVLPGFNVRPTELQAAIGFAQLAKLDAMLEGRAATAAAVHAIARETAVACTPVVDTGAKGTRSWMTLPFLVDDDVDRNAFCKVLEESGVETRPIIAGNLARHPAAKLIDARSAPDLSFADRVWSRGFMIGCHPDVQPPQLETIRRAFSAAPKRQATSRCVQR